MDPQEKEEQKDQKQQSHPNLIKGAKNVRSIYNKARNAKKAIQAVRAAATAIQAAAATWEIWVPLLVIGIIILVIVMGFIVIVSGGQQEGSAPSAISCSETGGTCSSQSTCSDIPNSQPSSSAVCNDSTKPFCCVPAGVNITCDNVNQMLLSRFGVKIKEVSDVVTCSDRKKIYGIYSAPGQSSKYISLLKPSNPFILSFYSLSDFSAKVYSCTTACGYTPSGNGIQLGGFTNWMNNVSLEGASFLLIHETGHLIRHRNSWITSDYPNTSLISKDQSCYESGYLKTYSRAGSNKISENIAEAMALYVYNSKKGKYATINNFKGECDDTYTWMKHFIFGDIIVVP